MQRPVGLLGLLFLVVSSCAGSSPDLTEWREFKGSGVIPSADLATGLAQVEAMRNALDLARARDAALLLVGVHPDDPRAQRLASRAESDYVVLYPSASEEDKALALWSALDWAEQCAAARPGDADSQGQLAWCLGATTHLRGMFARAGHATTTLEACERALELNTDQIEALRTKATLRLRLATLPWIAKTMAFGAPDGDLDEAVDLARRCVALRPSVENRLLLGKALLARGDHNEAEMVWTAAVQASELYPRDRELKGAVQTELDQLPNAVE